MLSFEPYKERSVKFIDQVNFQGWRIKVYGIAATSSMHSEQLAANGIEYVLPYLPQPAVTKHRYGVGFLIIHQGLQRNWFLLDWWENDDIVHHQLFSSPVDQPNDISAEPDKSLIACVHELRVIHFESEAWIRCVLSGAEHPGLDGYMESRFESS